MKKYNDKQLAWSRNKVTHSKIGNMLRLFILMFALFTVTAAFTVDKASDMGKVATTMAGGSTLAGMAAIGSIDDQTDAYTQGNSIAYEVGLVAHEQIDNTVAFPQPNASREVGAVALKVGEVAHKFNAHNIPSYNAKLTKGDNTVDPSKEFNIVMANIMRDSILNFSEQYCGGKFLVFWREVDQTQWYMIGSYDKPVTLDDIELKKDDANVAIFKFGHKSIKQFYKAATPSWAAPVTVAADATNLAISSASVYQLTDNTAAKAIVTISGLATADIGRYITVYGSGGTYPSTIPDTAGIFVLANGTTWTGNAGSRITLHVLDTGTVTEVERYQT